MTHVDPPVWRRHHAAARDPRSDERGRVTIVQQGAWDTPKESMPLAAAYLKAAALADPVLADRVDIDICNFGGGTDLRAMAQALELSPSCAVLAFSVLGWNYRAFGELATTYKQRRPEGLVVFGGTHVAYQGERVFRQYPAVDVIVNGEGEPTFADLLRWRDAGADPTDLAGIDGISFMVKGEVVTTPDRPRIEDLDSIPSPFLSGAMPMVDARGNFPYDAALMETNRGCPYKCAFCYWGGAVGTRVREFSRDRLRAELRYLAEHQVETVVLCDANFGMRRADVEFVDDFISIRNEYGYPRYLESSWAKNKSENFFEIVQRLKVEGIHSSFTLALQTLDSEALDGMFRRNMQLNEWADVAGWLNEIGVDAYAELIWGAPGETPESFLQGYDRLAEHVSRVAVYPLLVLPNTGYDRTRHEHELTTVRGSDDDFEYVLSHRTMSVQENIDIQRFLFWARLVAENLYFRHIWEPLHVLGGITQSTAIRRLAKYLGASRDPLAEELVAMCRPFADSATTQRATRFLYEHAGRTRLFEQWWVDDIVPSIGDEYRLVLETSFRYDEVTRPLYVVEHTSTDDLVLDSDGSYRRVAEAFPYRMDDLLAALRWSARTRVTFVLPEPGRWLADIRYKAGFADHLDNHEMAAHYVGTAENWRPEAPALALAREERG